MDEASQQGLLELVDPVGVDPFPYKLSARFGAYVQSLFRAFDSDKDGFLNSEGTCDVSLVDKLADYVL